ncbi:MAG: hypothetical protein KGL31_05355 [candidate division NC10 bacterium]|nr:hypothetical protein [candidate division NC10 bacterium]MDE2321331.1 hypothetical protein [candidate division NC10 bacterium]
MPDPKEQKPNLPLIGVVLLAATVGGVYFYGKPFESFRPREGVIETSSTLGPQFVPARLWEDPFSAVSKKFGQQPDQKGPMGMFQYAPDHFADHLKKQIKKQAKEHGKVTIMPVMVFGGPYAEQIEDRRRKRYAVLSALAVSDYEPVDGEHIDYVQIPWDPWPLNSNKQADNAHRCHLNPSSPRSRSPKGCLVIPYEWLLPKDKKLRSPGSVSEQHGAVLLLWLDNNLFDDQPLLRLEHLIKQAIDKGSKDTLSIKIIGPAGSTTLHAMVQEAFKFKKVPPALTSLKSSEIYSPNATVPNTLLIPENDTPKQFLRCLSVDDEVRGKQDKVKDIAGETIAEAFKKLKITFQRTIPTDNDLACSLKEELARRRVKWEKPKGPEEKPKNYIALIAEWDTFYGRSLPATFFRAFTGQNDITWEDACYKYGICRYSYMRGLDGETPLQEKEAAKTSKEAGEVKRDSQTLERAIGNSQFDYLRRLGSRIEREMEDMNGNVQAIGVLGSDVYDKLLILQALHDRFPSALFFTTDLDARYTHQAQSKWTRNLIVGSGFGLELAPGHQRGIPPFRDSYQTAVFYAVQVALEKPSQAQADRLTPRLFEIGRRQPFDLSVDQDPQDHKDPNLVHPAVLTGQKSVRFIIQIVGSIFVLALLLLWMVSRLGKSRLIRSGIVVVTPIALISALVTWQDAQKGEPLDLWEGISLWPSEAIRLYALFLAVGFIVRGICSLRNSNKQLSERYDLDIKSEPPVSRKAVDDQRSEELSVQQLWAWYREDSRGWPKRVLVSSVLYWCLIVTIFLIFASDFPVPPGRGEVSFWSDRVIVRLAVSSLIVLIFFVVDATRLCRGFIERLVGKPCEWPPQTLRKFADQHGMSAHPDDLREWLDIQLIAGRTRVVGRLVYYPFIVLLLMIVARSPLLDRWSQPWFLLLVFGLNAAWVIGCAIALRNRAEKSRRRVLDTLNRKVFQLLGSEADQIERIRLLIKEVEANRDGAFCPISEQPVVRTLLFFLGGSGGLVLLEYLIQSR